MNQYVNSNLHTLGSPYEENTFSLHCSATWTLYLTKLKLFATIIFVFLDNRGRPALHCMSYGRGTGWQADVKWFSIFLEDFNFEFGLWRFTFPWTCCCKRIVVLTRVGELKETSIKREWLTFIAKSLWVQYSEWMWSSLLLLHLLCLSGSINILTFTYCYSLGIHMRFVFIHIIYNKTFQFAAII